MNKRLTELDSLRGLAAIVVILYHYTFGILPVANNISLTPLYIFINGPTAVGLFFILSGFVLSLQYYNGKKVDSFLFIIRRIFRIYLPYVACICIYLLVKMIFFKHFIPTGYESSWLFNVDQLKETPSAKDILIQLSLIANNNANMLNGVVWSLVEEMKVSLIFPILMLFAIRHKVWHVLITYYVIYAICVPWIPQLTHSDINYFYAYGEPIFRTMQIALLFMIGAYLAKHRDTLVTAFKKQDSIIKSTLVLVALFKLCSYGSFNMNSTLPNDMITCFAVALGFSIIIIAAQASEYFKSFLNTRIMVFVGSISYGLYLYHMLARYLMVYALHNVLSLVHIEIISFVLTVIIAYASLKLIEEPSIKLGRIVCSNIEKLYGCIHKPSKIIEVVD